MLLRASFLLCLLVAEEQETHILTVSPVNQRLGDGVPGGSREGRGSSPRAGSGTCSVLPALNCAVCSSSLTPFFSATSRAKK